MDRRKTTGQRLKPRFILVTPMIEDAARFAPQLAAACRAADIAAVILRLAGDDDAGLLAPAADTELIARVQTLAPAVKAAEAALLLDGLLHLADPANVNGVHLSDAAAIASVRSILDVSRIIGSGGLQTRHDAMIAGEAGADYVMFGEPNAEGRRPTLPAIIERVTWWAELFEVPCVAYAIHTDEVGALLQAGANFIALGEEAVWNTATGPLDALAAASSQLLASEAAE